ncbi:MAG: carbohydrate-binding domain-containing protein [Clostridia bacterium]|nr:carbohydrate-binding domain-containing protein [Clostridia bacterium]
MKRIISLLCLVLAMMLCAVACSGTPDTPTDPDATPTTPTASEWELVFDGASYTAPDAAGVTREGNITLLTKPGTYVLRGTLDDGQIRVRVAKTVKVTLILDGLTATSTTTAPIYIESADKVTVVLKDGTTNTLTDAKNYVFNGVDTKPNACLYSSEDISFEGNGTLIVNANYNNGIGTKNDLKIKGGRFEITAVKNALKGNDSVTISGGDILITRCADGIKTDATEVGRGVLTVSGGTIEIHAEDDALQASQAIEVSGGSITVEALGKTVNCDGTINIADGCLVE